MTRILPDMAYRYVEEFGADAFIYDHEKQPAEGHYFHRSTILAAIDEVVEDCMTKAKNARRTHLIQQWQDRANTLRDLRARFQPTEGE